jgi:NAD dependent epimerase/dehydratase
VFDWRDRPVLVTGAGGFIGSHLAEALVQRGARVRGFFHYGNAGDRGLLERAPREVRDEVEPLFGDLRDAETIGDAVRGVAYVFHLGALVGIPYSYRSPRDVVETNVIGTLNVLMAAKESEVARLVHTSTSEVYGSARFVPMTEAHPLQAQSPYAASKIGADKLVESFHRSFGLPASIVRPFNTYGPRQSTRAIIPTIISQALAGHVVRLGATTPTRDLNFVTDTAAAFLSVAECEAAIGEVFNAGTGRETSVGELVGLIGSLTGRTLTVEEDPQRVRPATSEVDRLVADAAKLHATCGWSPTVSLEDGLRRTIDWFVAHGAGSAPDRYGV